MRRLAPLAWALLLAAALPARGQEVARGGIGGTAQTADDRGRAIESRIASSVEVPEGSFRPLYTAGDSVARVAAFRLDSLPVTVGDFLAFVEAEPRWRRGEASTLFVGEHYLSSWKGPLEPGSGVEVADRPVTEVSWFAARAFCESAGGRLPTTDEWEYAASMPEEGWTGGDSELDRRFLQLHSLRPRPGSLPAVGRTFRSHAGVWDLHGLVQEWTDDFNNQMLTGAGRDDRGLDRQLFCAAGSVGVPDPSDYAAFLRASHRASLDGTEGAPLLGFRCAYDLAPTRSR